MGTLNNATTVTQISEILAYLQTGKGLTKAEAVKLFGTLHLNGRIWDIKKLGHEILFVWEKGKNRHNHWVNYKRYFLGKFSPPNAVSIEPKPTSKAQKRYEAALEYVKNFPNGYSPIEGGFFSQALKIAAGIKP